MSSSWTLLIRTAGIFEAMAHAQAMDIIASHSEAGPLAAKLHVVLLNLLDSRQGTWKAAITIDAEASALMSCLLFVEVNCGTSWFQVCSKLAQVGAQASVVVAGTLP